MQLLPTFISFVPASRPVRKVLAGFALALVPLSLLAVHLLMQDVFAQARELRMTAEETQAVRSGLASIQEMQLNAETAVRGYAITQDESFLEPYFAARAQRTELFAEVSRRAPASIETQIADIERLSARRLAFDASNIADIRAGRVAVAQQRIATGEGKRMMDTIRARIATLDRLEAARLADLGVAGSGTRLDLVRMMNGLIVGLALLLAVVAGIIGHTMRQRTQALAQARRMGVRERAMFDSAVDGMLLLDSDGIIQRMNPSIVRMFGYRAEEMVGQHNMALMNESYSLERSQAWLHSVGSAGEAGAGRRQEFTGKRSDGSLFETEVAISQVPSASGKRYIAVIRDISERKRAERMKTEFVSTVSHELRTPLTSIGGSLSLLAGGAVGQLNDQAKRLIGIAHGNCERLIRLINDILDIEKIESGKMDFTMQRLQVAPLVRRTQAALEGFAEKHGVTLAVEFPPWPHCINGDADRLEQVLVNLASNAIKYSPAGETVELASIQRGGMVRIEARDRGAGIPIAFRDRIFGKFAMADASDSRAKGGTGLGLAIAREIASLHGGTVGFQDREGGGTIFWCELPLLQDSGLQSPEADENLPLVVHLDDDHDCLSIVASAFAGKARIVSVATLAEARTVIETRAVDGAILDIGLNPDDGLSLVPRLRELARNAPIVVFTASDEPRDDMPTDKVFVKSRAPISDLVETTMALIARARKEAA